MDAGKQYTINFTQESTSCSGTDDSDSDSDEDNDLPPIPFAFSFMPNPPASLKGFLVTPVINLDFSTNMQRIRGNIYGEDALLEEHFGQGGIMGKRAIRAAKEKRVLMVDEYQQGDFNISSGLSIFVSPICFTTEIDPFTINCAPLRKSESIPATMVKWLIKILLMSNDKMMSQTALYVLTALLQEAKRHSLPANSFCITYRDIMKMIMEFGTIISADGDIPSNPSPSDFKLQYKDKELLINNLNNFNKYLTILLTKYPQVLPSLCREKLIVLLLKISLDHHIIDSTVNITVLQCIGAVLSCYSENEWNYTTVDQLCQSFLTITDDHRHWCRIVYNIGNATIHSRQLQKQFARTVINVKTTGIVVPIGSSDLDFAVAFIQKLCNQKGKYDLSLLYCLLDVLFIFISSYELIKETDNNRSSLINHLLQLSSKIPDNPSAPITFVKDSIWRLINVLQCVPAHLLQQQTMQSYVRKPYIFWSGQA